MRKPSHGHVGSAVICGTLLHVVHITSITSWTVAGPSTPSPAAQRGCKAPQCKAAMLLRPMDGRLVNYLIEKLKKGCFFDTLCLLENVVLHQSFLRLSVFPDTFPVLMLRFTVLSYLFFYSLVLTASSQTCSCILGLNSATGHQRQSMCPPSSPNDPSTSNLQFQGHPH